MATSSKRLVPKVHPAGRPVEPEDPYSLHATSVGGDPEAMLQCLVQEYARMGWDAEQIVALFQYPSYPALNALWDYYGEASVRARIAALLRETGVFHVQVSVREAPEPEVDEPELIQIGVLMSRPAVSSPDSSKGDSHAQRL